MFRCWRTKGRTLEQTADRATEKVQADGYTINENYELIVGLNDITILDKVRGNLHDKGFDYSEWEYIDWLRCVRISK